MSPIGLIRLIGLIKAIRTLNNPDQTFLPHHGNYRELLSYQKAVVVYDLTCRFCQRFLTHPNRTIDQMV